MRHLGIVGHREASSNGLAEDLIWANMDRRQRAEKGRPSRKVWWISSVSWN
jgi:hypothetical protein